MRNFIIGMLGWWIGLAAAVTIGALITDGLLGMDEDSMSAGFTVFGLGIAGGIAGVRATRRFREPPHPKLDPPLI